jgi:hypothetical protein
VTNGIPLGCPLPLTVTTVNHVATLKGNWSLAKVVDSGSHSIMLAPAGGMTGKAVAVRYLWSTSPGSHPRYDETPGNVSVYGKGVQAM